MLPNITVFGLNIDTYKMFFYIALLTVPVMLFVLRKRFEFSVKQTAFYSAFTLVFGYISAMMTSWLKHIMLSYASGGVYTDAEKLRNYGIPMFLPIFLLVYCLLRKDDFRKLSDYIAPCVYSVMTFVKIGCVFCGCCYGEPDEHGIWNESLGYRTFPVQLYDAITSMIIVVICLYLVRRFRDVRSGYIYPIGGILFAITKGFWENFRVHESEYERSFLGTGWTLWQYWLLVLFLGCAIWLFILMKKDGVGPFKTPAKAKVPVNAKVATNAKTAASTKAATNAKAAASTRSKAKSKSKGKKRKNGRKQKN